MPPAARLTDLHACPMQTSDVPSIPHVGGPISGPGAPTVLIASLPAARVGDTAVCVGPPDTIVEGSTTVLIGGVPAARMGDATAHGGSIVLGCSTVLIGGGPVRQLNSLRSGGGLRWRPRFIARRRSARSMSRLSSSVIVQ